MLNDAELDRRVRALRCAMCGGPFGPSAEVGGEVACDFCGSLNLVESREARLVRRTTDRLMEATEEARVMYGELQPRLQVLEVELGAAYERGDLARALHTHEAILRLVGAPQYHILRAADQSAAWVQRSYRELERAVLQTLHNVREEWRASGRERG